MPEDRHDRRLSRHFRHLRLLAPERPPGSWSDFVGSWDLYRFGPATTTDERRSVAGRQHDAAVRRAAKAALNHPPVVLTGRQARAVARGFAEYARRSRLVVLACAILPDHVHLVLDPPHLPVERVVIQLKGSATRRLRAEGLEPPSKCSARGEWKVHLDPGDVDRAVAYVEQNPARQGLPRQRWKFVTGRA